MNLVSEELSTLLDTPGWIVLLTPDLPPGVSGATRWSDRTVWLSDGLPSLYRRFVLEHERQHVLRGPASARGISKDADELECDRRAVEAMWAAGLPVDVLWPDPELDLRQLRAYAAVSYRSGVGAAS